MGGPPRTAASFYSANMCSRTITGTYYGCRNGAKFNILKFYSYSTFIHSYSTFVSIQHYYSFKIQHRYLYSSVLFVHKIIVHSETIYPFNNFYSFKIDCASLLRMEVTYFLQRMNRGQRRNASDNWNFEKIPTAFALSSAKKGSADPNI